MSTVTILNEEMADILRRYHRAKNETTELRAKMLRIAVEELGMDQKDAMKTDIVAFIDGYLVGRGVMQSWRNINEGS